LKKHKKISLTENYWLINSNRSRVKRFSKNKKNRDKFFEYMFIDSGRIIGFLGKEPPLMTTREELKVDAAREKWEKLIAQGWRRTKPVWEDF
tara:strand:+ start:121 stop:396 length:276 start_codon:yes stop_codon:yes gene_type:complete